MGYTGQRDAVLAHAVAVAAAIDPAFTDVEIGPPVPAGNRCVRLFWAGEAEPEHMGAERTLTSRMVSPALALVAFWTMRTTAPGTYRAIDDEMAAFVHGLRTAILADSQLGGQSTDLEMDLADPAFVVIGNVRYASLSVGFTFDYLEYPLGA